MARIVIGPAGEPMSEVLVQAGALIRPAGEDFVPARPGRTKVAVLTQPGEPAVRARRLVDALDDDYQTAVEELPDRDDAKTLDVAGRCYRWLNELRLTRDDLIIGVGGGALTDVAGFVAGTYLRGVDAVLVPTTLLGAVDAAIGGKTGVNVEGKNLAGVFRHPVRVIIDPEVLAALPRHLIVEGAAEALKAGLIADPDLVDLYETRGLDAPLEEVVTRAVRVKAAVVTEDFTEKGLRAVLNYGHTIGHAVEMAAGLPHGHAVAVGMVAAGAAAERVTGFEYAARQQALIASLGLPTTAPQAPADQVRRLMQLDKKRSRDDLRMVLLEDIGRATVRLVDTATVDSALAAVDIAAG